LITQSQLLSKAAEEFPDKFALSYFKYRLTYSELHSISDSVASQLSEYVKKGDTVAILLQNIPQFVIVQHAVWKVGCTLLPINPSYSSREIKYCLSDSNAKLAIVQTDALERVLEASKGLNNKVISTNPTTFSDIPSQLFEKWGFREGAKNLISVLKLENIVHRPTLMTLRSLYIPPAPQAVPKVQ